MAIGVQNTREVLICQAVFKVWLIRKLQRWCTSSRTSRRISLSPVSMVPRESRGAFDARQLSSLVRFSHAGIVSLPRRDEGSISGQTVMVIHGA